MGRAGGTFILYYHWNFVPTKYDQKTSLIWVNNMKLRDREPGILLHLGSLLEEQAWMTSHLPQNVVLLMS